MPPVAAAPPHAPRLAPAASSGTPPALPATACPAPLALPEHTDRAARRVTRRQPLKNLLIGVALGRISLFISIHEIPVLFLALPTAEQLVKDTHVQAPSFADRIAANSTQKSSHVNLQEE